MIGIVNSKHISELVLDRYYYISVANVTMHDIIET